MRLRVGHALTVTETGLAFLQEARRRGELCQPLDWMCEVYHPVGSGEAVIPDAPLFYRRGREGGEGTTLRAFVEVDRPCGCRYIIRPGDGLDRWSLTVPAAHSPSSPGQGGDGTMT